MTNEQIFFYAVAFATGLVAWGVFFALLGVTNKTWGKIGENIKTAGLLVFFAAAFVAVVIPVYIATRLADGLQAFMDAALPEVSGLVYRVRATARAHGEYRLAGWRQSVEYDRVDHASKMAQFDSDDANANVDAEEAYDSVGVGERY